MLRTVVGRAALCIVAGAQRSCFSIERNIMQAYGRPYMAAF